jgi:hypothetical protein
MKMRIAVVIATITLLGAARVQASMKPEAQVTAVKGPVQITLRLQKTTVKKSTPKTPRSLWYTIELKNIGKKKLRVDDLIFKDPWAIYENCNLRHGIYLEIIDPKGEPLLLRTGGERVSHDWEPKGDETLPFTPEEQKEIDALQADVKKRGLSAQQQSLAVSAWVNELSAKKNMAESINPAKQLWLRPGASTTTFAWANRGPDEYPGRAEDDEALRGGYTELWSYYFYHPGKYRVRAVYNHAHPGSKKELTKEYGYAPESWWVEFKTPFIEFQVLP